MLAKVPIKRRDGKSSFSALTEYITRHAAAITHSENVWSLDTAAIEMERVALMNERVKDPTYHYVVSWPGGENPTDGQAFDAVAATLTALKMHDHQWIGAVHRNTSHVHAHVAVSRIHPETLKSVYPKGDWIVLDRTCRELELKHGWIHDRGPHRVELETDSAPRIVRTQRDLSEDTKLAPSTRARDFSAWNGSESFHEWMGKEPAQHLKRSLERPDATWQDVHRSLAAFNLEYRIKGSGAVVLDRDTPEKLHAKASHIGRFASLGRLETRLGSFEPSRAAPAERTRQQRSPAESKPRSYSQETDERVLRREHRQAEREALYERYAAAKMDWERPNGRKFELAQQRQRTSEKARFETLRHDNRAARERIKSSTTHRTKRILYSVQAYVAATKREALRLQIQKERTELRAQLQDRQPGPWREWLAQQAATGDKAAISALRGLRYREGRERRSEARRLEVGTMTGTEAPRKALLDTLRWTADDRGVNYLLRGATVFRDEGAKVVFNDMSDGSIRAGLMLCREKWARGIYIGGTDEFKSRATALATEMGIQVLDQQLQTKQQRPEPAEQLQDPPVAAAESPVNAVDLERLSSTYGKPLFNSELRAGRQHTGKVIAVERSAASDGIVVVDAGRELAVIRTDVQTAAHLQPKVGFWMCARASTSERTAHDLAWRFTHLKRTGPSLEYSL